MIQTLAPSCAQYRNSLWGDSVEVFCCGDTFPGEESPDWTLKHIKDHEAFKQNLDNENATIIRRLPEIGEAVGVRSFVAPSPIEFCGRIADPDALSTEISWSGVTVHRGVTADGCVLPKGEGYLLSAAGCAAVVARRRADGKIIAAHAGLRSLDRAPEDGHKEFQSVISSVVETLGTKLDVWIVLPIDPAQFTYPLDHPSYGEINQERWDILNERYGHLALPGNPKDGQIDIRSIVRKQLEDLGVPSGSVTIGPSTAEIPGFYTTRDEPPRNTRRNLIMVVRRA